MPVLTVERLTSEVGAMVEGADCDRLLSVIWDNRGVLHRACPDNSTSARDMHRTTFAGDEAVQ